MLEMHVCIRVQQTRELTVLPSPMFQIENPYVRCVSIYDLRG